MNTFASLFSINIPQCERMAKLKKMFKGSNENWEEKAIESLTKKLEKKPDALKTLEEVLKMKNINTPCITIARTLDGRIQINHQKRYPHFIYCKLWRWPNLKSHNELKPTGYCSKSFYSKNEKTINEVCINPYHYERQQTNLCAAASSIYQDSLSTSNSSFSSTNDQSMNSNQINLNESINCSIDQLNNSNYNSINQLTTSVSVNNFINNSNDQEFFNSKFDQSTYQMPSYSMEHQNSMIHSNFNSNVNENIEMDYLCTVTNFDPNYNFNNYQKLSSNQSIKVSNQPWCTIAFFKFKNRENKKLIINNPDVINGQDLPKDLPNYLDWLSSNLYIELYNENGKYFIKSNCKLFIQRPFVNFLKGLDLKCIVELPLNQWNEIFDENMFKKLIENHRHTNFEEMSRLTKYARCNLSFSNAWNDEFVPITQMCCWLDIQMDLALIQLNEALTLLNPPSKEQATSMS